MGTLRRVKSQRVKSRHYIRGTGDTTAWHIVPFSYPLPHHTIIPGVFQVIFYHLGEVK